MKIAKSTASLWLKDIELTNKAAKILIEKTKKRFFKLNNVEWIKGKKIRPKIWTKQKLNTLKKYYDSGLNMRES